MSVYTSTKAAVRSLVRSWLLDTKPLGIRINVLRPGHTLTPGFEGLIPSEAHSGVVATIPLGRLGTPKDLGKAAVFLAEHIAGYLRDLDTADRLEGEAAEANGVRLVAAMQT
jgi:NAD(P)-dependent dehydrogenase (short-subunit alcohol dehydrogenase family)